MVQLTSRVYGLFVSGKCGPGGYECAVGGSTCVTAAQLCDGIWQCSDGSDEDWRAECATSATTGTSHFAVP